MNNAKILIYRKLLQSSDPNPFDNMSTNDPTFNATTWRHVTPTTTFDASMVLTIIVLLTVFCFMGFFSAYIRRLSENHENPSPSIIITRPQNRKGGLDSSVINSLPLVPYGKAAKHAMIDECAICLSEFQEMDSVKLIPYCGHVFHPSCVDTWLGSHVTCPLCRSDQLFERCEEVCLNVNEVKEGSNGGYGDMRS